MAAQIKEGDRVRIVDRPQTADDIKSSLYYNHFRGLTGIVQKMYASEVAIEIDPVIQLQEDFYDHYFVYDDKIYNIQDKELDDDICEAHKNEDGTIDYAVQFYNGGTCLSEMLENALKKLKRKTK